MEAAIENALTNVTDEFLRIIEDLDEAKLNEKPNDDTWSAGQIADHIRKSYASADTINGNTIKTNRQPDKMVSEIKAVFLNFDVKMKSPQAVLPSEKPLDKQRLMEGLTDRINQFQTIIREKDLTLTCTDFAIPEYGAFTRIEWMWFNIYHTERHLKQLREAYNRS